jgi:hypothetical protein
MIRNSKSQIEPFFITLIVAVGVLGVLSRDVLIAGVTPYTSSAHGNTSYGVNRDSMSIQEGHGYPEGHCAHCHEQHASVGGTEPAPDNQEPAVYLCFRSPFRNQRTGFCVKCHTGQSSSQYGGFITNYDYSQRRGGESKPCPTDVRANFLFINYDTRLPQSNCESSVGSAHDLINVRGALRDNWGWGSDPSLINPCLGCHCVHRTTRDYPCSLPSGHSDKSTWEIWGDDGGEKMADHVIGVEIYQPPNKAGGGTERDADNQPNYNTLCLGCHYTTQNSYQHGSVIGIDWTGNQSNTRHGKGAATWTQYGPLRLPYDEANLGKYVLCCTDCHEPHGSRNEWLLRTTVNGTSEIAVDQAGLWFDLCNACHAMYEGHPGPGASCAACHGHGLGKDF